MRVSARTKSPPSWPPAPSSSHREHHRRRAAFRAASRQPPCGRRRRNWMPGESRVADARASMRGRARRRFGALEMAIDFAATVALRNKPMGRAARRKPSSVCDAVSINSAGASPRARSDTSRSASRSTAFPRSNRSPSGQAATASRTLLEQSLRRHPAVPTASGPWPGFRDARGVPLHPASSAIDRPRSRPVAPARPRPKEGHHRARRCARYPGACVKIGNSPSDGILRVNVSP